MAIQYAIHKNNLVDPTGGDYWAMVQYVGTADMNRVVERMMQRGSGVTPQDAQAALSLYHSTVETMVLEGYRVVTPLATFGAKIKGRFEHSEDSFNSARHKVEASVSAGTDIRRAVQEKAQLEQQEANKPQPRPEAFFDPISGERNGQVNPGRVGQVSGHRLKFDPADTSQGVFFIAADGNATRAAVVVMNTPRKIIFEVPAGLAAGSYILEVRAPIGTSSIRHGRLVNTLTVV
jgi:hypothetical protein